MALTKQAIVRHVSTLPESESSVSCLFAVFVFVIERGGLPFPVVCDDRGGRVGHLEWPHVALYHTIQALPCFGFDQRLLLYYEAFYHDQKKVCIKDVSVSLRVIMVINYRKRQQV